jgi:cysteinyl-tRNA synthetase
MDALNVELPDGITRVSEYVDDIVTFIAKIVDHGYAYESNGSVYFNVEKYTADGFTYCKLEPFNRNNSAM